MTKKAFIIGINTKGLKFCGNDAASMRDCLQKHGYNVNAVIDTAHDKWQILPQLTSMLENCDKTDTVIIYFSGHGFIDGGKLHLMVGDDDKKELSKIQANEITDPLSRCCADAKLVVLDCCHAGRSGAEWRPDPSDAYRILVAANPLQKSKELEDLDGSFLTHLICQALTECSDEIVRNGKIFINELSAWLEKRAREHNSAENSIEVPIPYLIGRSSANIEIASVEESFPLRYSRGVSINVNTTPIFAEPKMQNALDNPSYAHQKSMTHDELKFKNIRIRQLEKINELHKNGLLDDEPAFQLQFKVAEALLNELDEDSKISG